MVIRVFWNNCWIDLFVLGIGMVIKIGWGGSRYRKKGVKIIIGGCYENGDNKGDC